MKLKLLSVVAMYLFASTFGGRLPWLPKGGKPVYEKLIGEGLDKAKDAAEC